MNSLGSLDWAIIAIYLLAIVGLGLTAAFLRRKNERGGEGGHYFLAGNTLAWPVMGVALYTAAWVLRGILGLAPGATIAGVDALLLFITVMGVLTGIYTMLGGLLAVVWTESVQTVLLLAGAIVITVVGYLKIGGWTELAHTLATNPHPLAGVAGSKVTWAARN